MYSINIILVYLFFTFKVIINMVYCDTPFECELLWSHFLFIAMYI